MIFVLNVGVTVSSVHAQVDALNGINFLQTGTISPDKNKFSISSDISTREFFNGNIIRISVQTI